MRSAARLALGGILAATVTPFAAGRASAQTVDVSALEKLFGEPVTTSATGQPQRLSDVPADMEIITQDQIRRSGADDIPQVLRFVAGINVREYGEQDFAVSIRGDDTATNPRVLVLVDGRQVYEDDYGQTVWGLIPVTLREIRQIEIIKGPAAALYGFNAVSGVINIVTYDPLKASINSVVVDGGTQGQAAGEAVVTANAPGRYGVRLSAKGFRSDDFPGVASLAVPTPPRTGTMAFDGRFILQPGLEWDVSGSIGSLQAQTYIDGVGYTPTFLQENDIRSRLAADTQLGLLQLDVYRNENRFSEETPGFFLNWREDVVVVSASDLIRLGRTSTLRGAVEFRQNDISSLNSFDGTTGYSIGAASLMWNWAVTPTLDMVNALRVDDMSLDHRGGTFVIPGLPPPREDSSVVEPSFNSGVVLKVDSKDTLRVSAARAVQLPSLLDYGLSAKLLGGGLIVSGNPGLLPSPVMNYEVDFDRKFPGLSSSARLAAFVQRTTSLIGSAFGSGYSRLPTGQYLFRARNFGSSEEAGGELEWTGKSGSLLHWNFGYALAAVRNSDDTAANVFAASVNPQRQTPTNALVGTVGTTWRRVDLDLSARWQSRFQDYRLLPDFQAAPVVIPNYVTVDARLGYHFDPRGEIALTIEQLNSPELMETAGSLVARRILASLRYDL